MKKLISLILAISMMISATFILSSCGGKKPDNTETPEPAETRYTVTEEEWSSNMQEFNYTLEGKYMLTDSFLAEDMVECSYGYIFLQMTDGAVKSFQEQERYGYHDTRSIFQIFNDDGCFNVYKNLYTGSYEAIESMDGENEWTLVSETLISFGVEKDIEAIFSEFTYDEEQKCYTYSFEDYNKISISLSFADGVITEMKLEVLLESEDYESKALYEFSFTNVGTTVIEIPEYTVVER